MNATVDMRMLQARLQDALESQGNSQEEIAVKLKNFHFARDPMSGLPTACKIACYQACPVISLAGAADFLYNGLMHIIAYTVLGMPGIMQ